MTIYSVNSEILYEAPLTEGALIKHELMGDYYVELPFDAGSYIDIPRGSYIDHEGTRYTVMENIQPDPKDEGGYHYAVKFWAGQSFMKNRKLFWLKGANKEASFHITTTIDQFGQLVVDNMNEFMPDKWTLASLFPADALTVTKTISFEGDSCWDAVSSIAEAYGIEWWVHHDYDRMELYFGKLEGGNLVDFKVGEAITSIPSQKGDDSQYGTRFYVYGSNQNLPEGYGDTEQGGTVHHVSNPRLMLPSGIDYIDAKRDMTPAEIIEQVVIFEDVYPKNTDTVTAVTTVQRPIENAAEGQPQTFTAYQLIAANTPFLPSDVMEGETLRLVFNSGALTGVEFEVDLRDADDNHIDPIKWKPEDGFIKKFELIAITEQVGDTVATLPNESVHPVVGDEFVLLGVRLSDDKVREAEEELLQRGEEWKDEHSKDTNIYNCPTNPVYCKRKLLSFALGQRVRLDDPRFDGGYRDSRIQGFEKRIWNEYIATYTIGDNAAYTRIGAVESSVTDLKTTERTIGMILDNLSKTATNLQEMFAFEEDSRGKRIRAKYGLYSVDFISAKGVNFSQGGGSSGGGSSTLSGLNDVLLTSLASDNMLVYNGTHWVNTPMSAIKPDLSAYATKVELNTISLRLSNVETIFEADSDGAINKWGEVVAFLDGIEGDTLDSILSQFATKQWVDGKGYLTAITSAMVVSALGYTPYNPANFTKANIKSTLGISDWALAMSKPSYAWSEINNRPTSLSQFTDDVVSGYYLPIGGTAKNAEKLGGQAPAYYATATDLTIFKTLFDSLFELDEENNAIKAKLPLYSVGGISAKGLGDVSSGGGGGGGVSYDRLDSWDAYTSSMAGYVLSASLGYDLHTRLGVVERAGYVTNVELNSRLNALINGAPAAYDTLKEIADVLEGNVNSIGDIITTLGVKADKATTLAGYGITDAYTSSQVDNKLTEYLPLNGIAPYANRLNWSVFNLASEIDLNLQQWYANGRVDDIYSMGYSSVLQVGITMARVWQIWVSRTDHATHTRHTDGTNWGEEYTLLDDHNFSNYALAKDAQATDAAKLGGQAPAYYATATDLTIFKTLFDSLFELDEENNAIKAKLPLYSVGGISAKGLGDVSSGGGSSTLSGLNDVLLTSLASDNMLVYNGAHWVNTPMSAIKPDLSAYATKVELNTISLRLSNVETIFEADSDGAINKWGEVVAFLDGIEGDTLDSILSQFATKATTLAGYGITDAIASTGGTISGNLIVTGAITANKLNATVDTANKLSTVGNPTNLAFSSYVSTYCKGVTVAPNNSGAAVEDIGKYQAVVNLGTGVKRVGRLMFESADDSSQLFWQAGNVAGTGWGTKRKIAFADTVTALEARVAALEAK